MSRERGYSLVELLIVVAIIGIASMLAMAGWQQYRRRAQIRTSVRSVAMAVHLARTLAIARGITHFVTIDPQTQLIETFADMSAPSGVFDIGDKLVDRRILPRDVVLQLPPAMAAMPNPLGSGTIASASTIPNPDPSTRWGTAKKGFAVTPTGRFVSAEASPQTLESGVLVFSDRSGTAAAVGVRGQFGAVYAFNWMNGWKRIL